jgi:hypothetical protein
MIWNGISPQFATHPGNDRRLGYRHSKMLVLPAMITAILHGSKKPLASRVTS